MEVNKNTTHHDRPTCSSDFERAFEIADRLLPYELGMKWIGQICTKEVANDTVAALRQARDLTAACAAAGLEVTELTRWVVEWGREWKAEETDVLKMENGEMKIGTLTSQPELAQTQ